MYQKIVNDFVFMVGIDSAILMGWDNDIPVTSGMKTVPTAVDNNPVVAIAEDAFKCTYIEYLDLPATITKIGKNAFRGGSIKGIRFYADDKYHWQEKLKIETAAFKDCIMLEYFLTMQYVDVGCLAFCGCPKLKESTFNNLYCYIIHPEAFACTQSLKEIHVTQNGWMQVDALKNSSITDVYLAEVAKIPDKTIEYIRKKGITLHIYPDSPLMDLAYEGIRVEESLPF